MHTLKEKKGAVALFWAVLLVALVAISTYVFYNFLNQFIALTRTQFASAQDYYYAELALQRGKWILDTNANVGDDIADGKTDSFTMTVDGTSVDFYIRIMDETGPDYDHKIGVSVDTGTSTKTLKTYYKDGDIVYLTGEAPDPTP